MLRAARRADASPLLSWLSSSAIPDSLGLAESVEWGDRDSKLQRRAQARPQAPSQSGLVRIQHLGALGARWHCAATETRSGDPGASKDSQVDVAAAILQQVAVRRLRDHLKQEAQDRIVLLESEVLDLIKSFGITADEAKAGAVMEALQTSGVMLRYQGKVFIKPEDVADLVVQALPDTVEEAQSKVKEIEAELQPLEAEFAKIERQAHTWRTVVAYSGLALLLAQFSLFARLTYWEFSWDVMEPVSYFTGQLVMIICYMYFLFTNKDFGYEQHFNGMTRKQKDVLMCRRHFDAARFDLLRRDLVRWQRYAKALAVRRP